MMRVAELLTRSASLVSAKRTRDEDDRRAEFHGNSEAATNVKHLIGRLEKVVEDLEKSVS